MRKGGSAARVHRSACCQQGAANLLFVVPIPLTSPPHTQNTNTHQNTTQMEGIGYKVDGVEGIKASGLHVVHEVKPGQPLSQGTVVTLTLAETSACIPYVNSPPQVPWALGNGPKGGVVLLLRVLFCCVEFWQHIRNWKNPVKQKEN